MAEEIKVGEVNEWFLLKKEFKDMILELGKKHVKNTIQSHAKLEKFADSIAEKMAKQRFLLSRAIAAKELEEARLRETCLVFLTSQISAQLHRLDFEIGTSGYDILKDALYFSVKTMISLIFLAT